MSMPILLVATQPSDMYGQIIDAIGRVFESAGVVAVIVGCVFALAGYVLGKRDDDAYAMVRRRIGRSILLGLELFVAGDIIRTVTVSPTFTTVGVLAVIVLIRTFLSFTLEVEIEGRWPWQKGKQ
jgi:uncharacterized membrane protein